MFRHETKILFCFSSHNRDSKRNFGMFDSQWYTTVVGDYINTMKTTFELKFD